MYLIQIAGHVLCGGLVGKYAKSKGYEEVHGFLGGIFFGIFPLVVYACLPNKNLKK